MHSLVKIAAILSIFCFSNPIFAQIDLGVKIGLHSYDLPNNVNDNAQFKFSDADFGFHAGLEARLKLLGLNLKPAIIFNNIAANYTVVDTMFQSANEGHVNVDFPIMLGFKFLMVNIFAGPVAHVRLSSYGDLFDFEVVKEGVSDAFFGLQIGTEIGLNEHFSIDLRFEKNFGSDITIGQTNFRPIDENSRLLASLGYYF